MFRQDSSFALDRRLTLRSFAGHFKHAGTVRSGKVARSVWRSPALQMRAETENMFATLAFLS